tara:strand:+ start:5356 stop:6057 length:702 start_codon:yes stop_codon:yes gene_type:complete
MDCQKLIVYGILLLVGIYVLRDVCGIKLPLVEGMENTLGVPSNNNGGSANVNANMPGVANNNAGVGNSELLNSPSPPSNVQAVANSNSNSNSNGVPSDLQQPGQLSASEPSGNEFNLPIQGIQTAPANCYPQNTLTPQDLLPEGQASQIEQFNEGVPEVGEGILRGVNYLDSGFHIGVNTIGQSLRNANLNLRAEPPNPRTQVSPWMMSTIDPDLARRPMNDGECNTIPGQTP